MSASDRLDASLVEKLVELERTSLLRRPRPTPDHRVIDLCSNDYLGLRKHPAVIEGACAAARRFGTGAGASRLVGFEEPILPALERRLAQWMGTGASMLFPSGWHANVGVLGAFAGPGDALFSDALNHASLIDGMRLARAERHVYPHNDVNALEAALASCDAPGRKLIVTESIFSMDGDAAPIEQIVHVAERYGAHVIVDEAHALGVVGPQGRGLVAAHALDDRVAIRVGTLGKSFGASGAFVACSETTRMWLYNRARTFVFTTGVSPAVAGAIDAALDLVIDGSLQIRLAELVGALTHRLATEGLLSGEPPAGAIVPIVVGDAAEALALSAALEARGFRVTAIRPPTVPRGTSRLRITLRADLDSGVIDTFVDALCDAIAERGLEHREKA